MFNLRSVSMSYKKTHNSTTRTTSGQTGATNEQAEWTDGYYDCPNEYYEWADGKKNITS